MVGPVRPQPSGESKLRPRDFQFSIAQILVATTLCAVLLAAKLPTILGAAGWLIVAGLVMSVLFTDWSVRHVRRGHAATQCGDYARAVSAYTRAIEADPEDPLRYCYRAVAHHRKQDEEAALSDCTKAIALDARCVRAWIGRAAIHYHRGEFQKAIDDATIGLCLAPRDCEALLLRAWCYYAAHRPDDAVQDLNALLPILPQAVPAYELRGSAHLVGKNYAEALADFDRAIQQGARDGRAPMGRCIALFKLGRYSTALPELEEYHAENPQDVEAICALSWFLATCPDAACRDGQRALELAEAAGATGEAEPWSCEASLAAACAELGRFGEAVAHGEKALELAPGYRREDFEARLAAYKSGKPYREHGARGEG